MLDIAFPPSFSEARGLERGRFADPFRIDCGLLCCPPAPGGAASVPAAFVTVLSHWNCVPPRGDSGGCAGAGKHVTNRADLAGPHSARPRLCAKSAQQQTVAPVLSQAR